MRLSPFPIRLLVVEGRYEERNVSADEAKRLRSVTISSGMVHGVPVVRTTCIDETVVFVRELSVCLTAQMREGEAVPLSRLLQVTWELKRALDANSILPRMLCHVHGCSGRVAKDIAQVGESLMTLHDVFESDGVLEKRRRFEHCTTSTKRHIAVLFDFLSSDTYS